MSTQRLSPNQQIPVLPPPCYSKHRGPRRSSVWDKLLQVQEGLLVLYCPLRPPTGLALNFNPSGLVEHPLRLTWGSAPPRAPKTMGTSRWVCQTNTHTFFCIPIFVWCLVFSVSVIRCVSLSWVHRSLETILAKQPVDNWRYSVWLWGGGGSELEEVYYG